MNLKIAHRGLSHNYKDNSRLAFEKAIEYNFDMIEVDVQMCKDGSIVVHHDIYYKNKYIQEYEPEELQNEGMLLLPEFLEIIKYEPIKVFFDLKGHEQVIVALLDGLKVANIVNYGNIYISSFNRRYLDLIGNYNLPIKKGFTTGTIFNEDDFVNLTIDIDFLCLHWTSLNRESITFCKQNNILVFSYTVDNNFVLEHMKKFDVDGVISNYFFE
jgi:glycerophosphoryl diester phosphodiesterase